MIPILDRTGAGTDRSDPELDTGFSLRLSAGSGSDSDTLNVGPEAMTADKLSEAMINISERFLLA